jgi:hypothetical protein
VLTAAYVRNLSPAACSTATPHELFTGHTPDASRLGVFGSKAFALVPRQQRVNKLAPVSLQGVMVGYAAGTGAYRIHMLLPNNTIIVWSSVEFRETEAAAVVDQPRTPTAAPVAAGPPPVPGPPSPQPPAPSHRSLHSHDLLPLPAPTLAAPVTPRVEAQAVMMMLCRPAARLPVILATGKPHRVASSHMSTLAESSLWEATTGEPWEHVVLSQWQHPVDRIGNAGPQAVMVSGLCMRR